MLYIAACKLSIHGLGQHISRLCKTTYILTGDTGVGPADIADEPELSQGWSIACMSDAQPLARAPKRTALTKGASRLSRANSDTYNDLTPPPEKGQPLMRPSRDAAPPRRTAIDGTAGMRGQIARPPSLEVRVCCNQWALPV